MRLLRLYFALYGARLRSQLQYRTNCVVLVFMGLIWQGTGFIFLWIILSQFHALVGWTLSEVAFLYGFRLVVHAFSVLIFGLFHYVEDIVRIGEFDIFLTRPLPPILQIMTYQFPVSVIGDLIEGILILLFVEIHLNINWSPLILIYFSLAIVGGCLVEASIKLTVSSLTFRTLSSAALVALFDDILSLVGSYPLAIYSSVMRFFFTFIFPVAFLSYLPVTVLLQRTGELNISPTFALVSPLVGITLFACAYLFFEREVKHYQSTGH